MSVALDVRWRSPSVCKDTYTLFSIESSRSTFTKYPLVSERVCTRNETTGRFPFRTILFIWTVFSCLRHEHTKVSIIHEVL